MLNAYSRRAQGKAYLKTTLSKLISSIVERGDLDLEINPLKLETETDGASIGGNSSGGEDAVDDVTTSSSLSFRSRSGSRKSSLSSSRLSFQFLKGNPQAQKAKKLHDLLEERTAILADVVRGFLDMLVASIDQVPFGIRWICKQIYGLVKQKFPDANDLSIASVIGGFFMLRYLNPAIVSPEEFTLVKSKPSETTKRTLTLIAKVLQNLANKTTSIKEDYMTPLFPFIETHKERVAQFFLDLCNVDDFDIVLEMEMHLSRSRCDAELTIALGQISTLQKMLNKHLDTLAPHSEDALRQLLDKVGNSLEAIDSLASNLEQPQVVQQLQQRITLHLLAPGKSKDQNSLASTVSIESDVASSSCAASFNEAATVFSKAKKTYSKILHHVQFESTDVCNELNDLDLYRLADLAVASRGKNFLLSRQGSKALQLLFELKSFPNGDELLNRLAHQVTKELESLQLVTEKFVQEFIVLESVLADAFEQEELLRTRIQYYSEYLVNMRNALPRSVVELPVADDDAIVEPVSSPKPSIWNFFLHRMSSQSQLQK
ncbi:UNVERIFIED_CONTAM: glyceraldehyde-3-phosphate dehydrogenase 1 [Siphonaria sp. JEL0065]|nr:glyceraldehyde-3-phosphate dehydrogenase 1 [Siphonaria sp. JEL0065]